MSKVVINVFNNVQMVVDFMYEMRGIFTSLDFAGSSDKIQSQVLISGIFISITATVIEQIYLVKPIPFIELEKAFEMYVFV